MATEYSKKTNAELIEILKSRSLPHTGKKAELVARLLDADKADANKLKPAAPAKADTAEDVIDWDDDATPAETPADAKTTAESNSAVTIAGVKGKAANAAAIPKQKIDIDPSTTHDLKVVSTGGPRPKLTKAADDVHSPQGDGTNGAASGTVDKPAEKAAVDYSMGLASTDLDAELAKRKARAAKFGIVEDDSSALKEAQKALERAQRFGTTTEGGSSVGVKGLDEALPSERRRKRGRVDDGDNAQRGKRRDFSGRGRGRMGRGIRRGGRNGSANDGQAGSGGSRPGWSEMDALALAERKKRFG
jgi:SAP domain-containing ribonucleoprotein